MGSENTIIYEEHNIPFLFEKSKLSFLLADLEDYVVTVNEKKEKANSIMESFKMINGIAKLLIESKMPYSPLKPFKDFEKLSNLEILLFDMIWTFLDKKSKTFMRQLSKGCFNLFLKHERNVGDLDEKFYNAKLFKSVNLQIASELDRMKLEDVLEVFAGASIYKCREHNSSLNIPSSIFRRVTKQCQEESWNPIIEEGRVSTYESSSDKLFMKKTVVINASAAFVTDTLLGNSFEYWKKLSCIKDMAQIEDLGNNMSILKLDVSASFLKTDTFSLWRSRGEVITSTVSLGCSFPHSKISSNATVDIFAHVVIPLSTRRCRYTILYKNSSSNCGLFKINETSTLLKLKNLIEKNNGDDVYRKSM